MHRLLGKSKADTLAVAFDTARVSADGFPPLEPIADTVSRIWETSKRVKSVKKECRELADWAATIFCNIWKQTRDYEQDLPEDVQGSIDVMGRIFSDIVAFMKQLENQGLIQRFCHQDINKDRIEGFHKSLDKACESFHMNMNHPHTGTAQHMATTVEDEKELDSMSREPHDVIDVSLMSDEEREKLLSERLVLDRHRIERPAFIISCLQVTRTTTTSDLLVHRHYHFCLALTVHRPFLALQLRCSTTKIRSKCNYCFRDFIESRQSQPWGQTPNQCHSGLEKSADF